MANPWEIDWAKPSAEGTSANPWDRDWSSDKPVKAATKDRSWAQVAADTGVQLAEGTNNILGAVPSLVAPGSDASEFFKSGAEYWRNKQSEEMLARQARASEVIDRAGQDGVWSQVKAAASEYASDPALAARFAVTNIPSMIPGLGLGKLAQVGGAAAGLSAAGQAALGTGVAGATNAALNAGGARGDAYDDIKKSLISKGVSPADAEELALQGSVLPAAVGAATGYVGGRIGLEKALLGQATAGGALKKAAGAFGAEMTGEQIEEVLPKLTTNLAVQEIDPERKLTQDIGRTMVETALGAGPTSIAAAGTSGLRAYQDGLPPAAPANPPVQSPSPVAPSESSSNQALPHANPAQAATNTVAKAPNVSSAASSDTSAAEKALLAPVELTSLDRVNEIDKEDVQHRARLAELNDPANGYGPMFDQERQDIMTARLEANQEREDLAKDWPKSVLGTESSFTTEAGARVNAQYALMDAGDLITSHDEGLRKNPLYPPELQPRERDRAASEMQVSGIVQKLDPARLGLSADAANGAPIVGADGLVESGNARTIAVKRVYQANGQKATDYKQFLRDNAAQFGITPESVDAMTKPVLVRVRTTPVNRAEFARQANASTVAMMSPSEQAKSDANRIDGMEDLMPDDNGDFSNAASRPFVRRFMARLPMTERSGMMDSSGNLSTSGYARVRNAVLAKAYGDSPVLARMTESMDDNLRNVSKALMLAAPKVAQMRAAVKAGNRFDADITPDLMMSVEELSKIKDDGGSVQDALAQTDIMGDQRTPEARQLLQFLNDNMRRPRRMADFITAYMDALDAMGDPKQDSMFGDTQAPTKKDLLTAAEKATQNVSIHAPDGANKEVSFNEVQDSGSKGGSASQEVGAQDGRQPADAQGNREGAQTNGRGNGPGQNADTAGQPDAEVAKLREAAAQDIKDALNDLARIAKSAPEGKPTSKEGNSNPAPAAPIAETKETDGGNVAMFSRSRNAALLAPNGKPSKLTPGQHAQVRTAAFKAWFGDWELAANLERLKSATLARVTGAEFGVGFDAEPVSMPSIRHAAKTWADEHLVGEYKNARSGLVLEVRHGGIEQAIQHGGAADKIRAFAAIGDVLRDGIVVYDGVNPKNPRGRLVVVSGKVAINGKSFYVSAGFREDANGRLFYDHELMGVDRAEQLSSQRGESLASKHPLLSAHLNDYTVRYLGQDVQASKVVDENGEPLVVYHGTAEDIDGAFKLGVRSSTRGIDKLDMHYFTPKVSSAELYALNSAQQSGGGNIVPVFLNLPNPLLVFNQDDVANNGNGFIRYYDDSTGTSVSDIAEIAVSESTQIKSAIGNNGQFDGKNPDIRFSFAGRNAATADTHALETAEGRLAAGEDAETVRKETGWFKGADGKMRFEINDSGAFFKGMGTFGEIVMKRHAALGKESDPMLLGDILYHPALFAAYPNLRNIEIEFTRRGDTNHASLGSDGVIRVRESLPSDEALSAILHEVQHAIQNKEGFASGGNPETAAMDKVREINESLSWVVREKDAIKAMQYESGVDQTVVKNQLHELDVMYRKLMDDRANIDHFGTYKRLAGETEARNAQTRQRLTDAQRREQSPESTADVKASDVIVVFNGTEMHSAPPPANATPAPTRGMAVDAVRAIADRIQANMPNMPEVVVLVSPTEAPAELLAEIQKQGAMDDVEGAMHDGKLYLFASGLTDALRAEHVLAEHEAAHFGLRAILGDSLKAAMLAIYNNNAAVRKAATELQKRGKLSNAEATEEVIVDIPSSQLVKLKGWRKVVLQARDWLAGHGFDAMAAKLSSWLDGSLTDQQRADLMVASLVRHARAYMAGKRGKRVQVRPDTMLSGTLAEDAAKQEQWLSTEARARGYSDIDQLAEKNYPLFEKLAQLWRKKHPADNGVLLSRGKAPLLAPNGKPSKLTPGQHAQVRTPQFKAWFGDWEAVARQGNNRAVIERALSDKQWQERTLIAQGDDADPSGKLSEAFGFHITKQYITPDDIRKTDKKHGEGNESFADQIGLTHDDYVKMIEVLRDPQTYRVTTSKNGKPSAEFGYKFSDGTYVVAEVEVSEANAVSLKTAWKKVTGRNHAGATAYPVRTTSDNAASADIVHSDSLLVNPDTVSKAVDENGEPMVVYHGTDADFSEFKTEFQNTGQYGGKGFFFTERPEVAGNFGSTVMPVFLNARTGILEKRRARAEGRTAEVDHIHAQGDDRNIWAVFDSTQIKSATGNNGQFDGTNPDIRLSRAPTPSPVGPNATPLQKAKAKVLSLTSPEALDKLMYDFADKYIDLKRIRDHIKAIGGTITDLNDAYLGEELYHKRLSKRVEDFLADEVKPLLADLRARGVGAEAFEQFLHARHAPEANKAMAARNPTQDEIDAGKANAEAVVKALEVQLQGAVARGAATVAIEKSLALAREEGSKWVGAQAFKGTEEERLSLSGMSDDQAKAVMEGLSPAKLKNMQALAARVDAINAKTMDTLGQYGLMDQESLDQWRKAYQFYIPLHRDEAHPDSTSHPIGQGFSVKGDASKRRTGSNAKVTNILGHIAMQREAALTRGEKNTVVKKLYVMAAQNPDAELWEVGRIPTISQVDKKSGFVHSYPDPMYKNKPNVVMVRIAGKDAAIVFNEHNPQGVRLAGAMKNMDVGDLGAVLTQTARVTRWFAAVNTQYNPVFGLMNFARDIQAAMMNLSTTPLAGQQAKVARGVPAALRAVYRVERGKAPANAEGAKWAKLWEDLQEVGGTTGYKDMYSDASDRMDALLKDLQKLDRGQASQAAHAVVDWLSDYNDAIENGVRLSAYSAALDQGMSRERAASLAKNLTVNFNRKGAKARDIGALYAFFNAAIQGNARMFETLRGPMGKKIMFGGVALGMITSMLGMAVMGGGDGEDDEWEKVPEFVKERAIVIPLGHKDYIAIPMPLGFHVLPNLGRLMAEWAMGGPDKSLGKQIGKVLGTLTESFNPIGGGSDIGQIIMPTVLDPFLALWRNKDWTGRPIYREDNNSLDPTPGFTRARDAASTFSKLFAEAINWISGGSEYRPGKLSPTPDQIDYVIGQVTGGLGREIMKAEQVLTTPFTGDELPAHKIPVIGRIYGNTRGAGAQSGAFYENVRTLNEVENEVKGRNKNDNDADGYMEREPLTNLIGEGNRQEKVVSRLRKQRKQELHDQEPGYKDRVKVINTQIEEEMRELNRAVSRVKNEHAKGLKTP